jgi:hypothetical protein
MKTRYPQKISDLPKAPFFALLKPESVTIPGDERSRTAPGHGYPEHSVDYWSLEVFLSKEDLVAEVQRLGRSDRHRDVQPIMVTPFGMKIEVSIEVSIDELIGGTQ